MFDLDTNETERVYDPNNNRTKVAAAFIPLVFLNVLLLCVVIVPFAQWYVQFVAPACVKRRSHAFHFFLGRMTIVPGDVALTMLGWW